MSVPFDDDQRLPGGGRLPVPPVAPEAPQGPEPPAGPLPLPNGQGGRGGETPRERVPGATDGAVPPRPMAPSPVAGGAANPPGLSAFSPMPGGAPGISLAKPRGMGALFGAQGGLQGGGLGLPFDPISNQKSPDISGLISLLKKGSGSGGVY